MTRRDRESTIDGQARVAGLRRPGVAPGARPARRGAALFWSARWLLVAIIALWAVPGLAAGQPTAESSSTPDTTGITVPPDPPLAGRKPNLVAKVTELRGAALDDTRSAAAWGHLGWTFMLHGLSHEGVDCLTRAAQLDPGDTRWPYLAGLTLLRIDRKQARSYLQKAAEIDGGYVPARVHYGGLLAEVGQVAEWRAQFAVVLERQPDSWHVRLAAARAAQVLGDLGLALRYLDQAASLAPDEREVRRNRAHLFSLLNDAEQTSQEHTRAQALPPSRPMADLVKPGSLDPGITQHCIPTTQIAEELHRPVVANIVMVGFFAAATDLVGVEALRESVKASVPAGTEALNLTAFEQGYAFGLKSLPAKPDEALSASS